MKAAFLSSSLISPKGSARPATRSLPPSDLVDKSRRAEAIYSGEAQKASTPADKVAHLQQPTSRAAKPAETLATPIEQDLKNLSQKMKKDRLGRVRMSIRMTPEQHLHLKLISAHSKLSAQSIIEQAMDEYVERHGGDIIPSSCACIRNKIFR